MDYILITSQVFLAEKRGSSECYAAKRITCRDSAAIEKQQEVHVHVLYICVSLVNVWSMMKAQ